MSDRKKRSYSKETQEKIDRDLDDSIERRRSSRRKSVNKKRQSDEKTKKEKSNTKKKDYDYVTVDISRRATSSLLKSAGLNGDSTGTKISAKISYKVKK